MRPSPSRRSLIALLLASASLAATGCGSSSPAIDDSPPAPGYTLVGTSTDIDVCNTDAAAPLLRCTASNTTTPRLALAVCGDLVVNAPLTLDQDGSNVEVSGTTTTSAPLSVDGAFSSTGSVTATNTQSFAGDFTTAGDWTTSAPVTVGGNATLGGALNAGNTVTVTGTTTQNVPGVTLDLACAQAPRVATLVSTAAAQPDADTLAILPSASLVNVDAATELTLGCGQYALDSLGVNAALTLHIQGTTTLLVTGDVHVAAPLVIDLKDSAAMFDLAIGGALTVDNTVTIGGADDGARASQIWVGVGGAMTLGAPVTLDGSLLVNGLVTASNTLDVTGSAFLGGLAVASPVNVHLTAGAPATTTSGCAIPGEADGVLLRSR
jgi:uncharacterized protein YaaQ